MGIAAFGRGRGADPMKAARAVDASDFDESVGAVANQNLATRDAIRADALTFVARCRVRAGGDPTIFTPLEARMAFTIADMGILIVGQELTPLDPAFDNESPPDQQTVDNMSTIERALRRKDKPKIARTDPPPIQPVRVDDATLPSVDGGPSI